jgi:hypothetical protein
LRSLDEPAVTGPADPSLVDRLGRAGWRGQRLDAPYVYTAGRVYVSDSGIHRGRRLRADALLRAERSLPIAVAQLLRPREDEEEALVRLEALARERLGVPFAYLVRPGSGITEIDRATGGETRRSFLTEFPAPAALLGRWLTALGLDDDQARNALCFPYEVRRDQPLRYYQEVATNWGVAAVLQARRGRRPARVLITQATGTAAGAALPTASGSLGWTPGRGAAGKRSSAPASCPATRCNGDRTLPFSNPWRPT